MFSFIFIVIIIPLIILSFWFTNIISIIILVLYLVIEIMGIVPTLLKIKPSKELNLNDEESKIFSKYYAFLRYTLGAKDISKIFAIIQISALILVPLFLYKGLFIQASILAINYFVIAPFTVKLNPAHYLGENIKKGKLTYIHEYELLKVVSDKINAFQDAKFKKEHKETV